jgi:hypothetical protein
MLGLYIFGALLGWFGGTYVYLQLSSRFKQSHPIWLAALVGGIVGLAAPPVLNVMQRLLTK